MFAILQSVSLFILFHQAASLVRTDEDADVALKLSSALTQALLQYHINNAASVSHTPRLHKEEERNFYLINVLNLL